jgi:hypothetical protein
LGCFTKEALGKGYKLEFLKVQVSQFPEDRPFDGWACDPTMSGRVLGFGGGF